MLAFFLSKAVPQDPALTMLRLSGTTVDESINPHEYNKVYNKLGLQKPNFYFSIKPNNHPSNINLLSDHNTKVLVGRLLKLGMKGDQALALAKSSRQNSLFKLNIEDLRNQVQSTHSLQTFFYPKLHWHGLDNQYHSWFSSFLRGDMGLSFINRKDVFHIVGNALIWTLHLGIGAVIMAYFFGILIGYILGKNPEGQREKILNQFLYVIYSIPTFWLATILVLFFTTDDYGQWTNIFPSVGIDIYPQSSTWVKVWRNLHKLFLPIILGSLFTIAYLARILRRSIIDEMEAPYIMTAYSKGLTHKEVVKKHALPNSILPIITIFGGSIPAIIAGSVVLEVIFNIPGIGRLLFDSIGMADWNVVFCIIMLISFATIIAYLLSDLVYAFLNPKIRFT